MANPENPRYVLVRAQNTTQLVVLIQPYLADGVWQCTGGPFYDSERREWCQAVTRTEQPAARPGEVPLREVKRRAL
jgi:hypothetical protein